METTAPAGAPTLGVSYPEETIKERLERLDRAQSCDLRDLTFLLNLLKSLQGGRERGVREAAGLIRASVGRVSKTHFLVGKQEQVGRMLNNGLLTKVSALIELYANDVRDGKV